MPAWIQHTFFVSLYLRLLTQKELSMCSHSLVTATIEVDVLMVFFVSTLALEILALAVDFLSSLRLADIASEPGPGKFLGKLLRIHGRPLPIFG